MNGLEFTTTEELLEELFSRFQTAVFLSSDPAPSGEGYVLRRRFKGNDYYLIGLLNHMSRLCSNSIQHDEEQAKEE